MRTKAVLPEFTAEASLYRTAEQYAAAAGNAVADPNQVVPQYGLCDKAAYYCNRGYQKWCDILDKFCLNDF